MQVWHRPREKVDDREVIHDKIDKNGIFYAKFEEISAFSIIFEIGFIKMLQLLI